MLRLLSVSVSVSESRLRAVVDHDGKKRVIIYTWMEKEPTGIPPSTWFDTVCAEAEHQASLELARGSALNFF